jgi:replicative DNA helicase
MSNSGSTVPITRSLPQDAGAEAAVIASVIVDPRCADTVFGELTRHDFLNEEHRILFDSVEALYTANGITGINGLLVRQWLEARNLLEKAGGVVYLERVINTLPSSAAVAYYVRIVREASLRRRLIVFGGDTTSKAYDESSEIETTLDEIQASLSTLAEGADKTTEEEPIQSLLADLYTAVERRAAGEDQPLSTGLRDLDDKLSGGLHKGDMVILAARPSMGKSALALNIADYVGRVKKKPVAVVSLEMGRLQVTERMACSLTKLDSTNLRRGMVSKADFTKLNEAITEYELAPIKILDRSSLTPFELRARARRLHREYGIALIVVDYLQLMTVPHRTENRQQEVTAISRQIKGLAMELGIPLLVLSQLNRAPEGRPNHRPRLSDLRESGAIEQDADVVMMLYREDANHKGEEGYIKTNVAEVIIAKQRYGPTGMVRLRFDETHVLFENDAGSQATAEAEREGFSG